MRETTVKETNIHENIVLNLPLQSTGEIEHNYYLLSNVIKSVLRPSLLHKFQFYFSILENYDNAIYLVCNIF
jgi:hypothetical protein